MKDMDQILKQALSPDEHADAAVIASIRDGIKEGTYMKENKNKKVVKKRTYATVGRFAAAFAVVAMLAGGTAFAAEKLNLFGRFFGDSSEEPIASYVTSVEDEKEAVDESVNTSEETNTPQVYEGVIDDYKVSVEKMLYCDETNYGMVQFRVEDLTGQGRQWCKTVEYVEQLQAWDLSKTLELTETSDGEESPELCFFMEGGSTPDFTLYGTKVDDNTTICQMVYGSFEYDGWDVNAVNLIARNFMKGVEQDELKLNVPVGESLPSYVWTDNDGKVQLKLSSVNYMLFDGPEESFSKYEDENGNIGKDLNPNDLSIKMKDGSEYILYSESREAMHQLHGCAVTRDDVEGNWYPFDRVLDLNEVASFQVDGMEFAVSDAQLK